MKKWYETYIRSIRKDILILFFTDVSFLLTMELVLRRIPAPFPFFVKIGDFFVALGVALIASIVFYFVQVHLPSVKEKENMYPVISILFLRVLDGEKSLLTKLLGLNEIDLSEESIRAHTGVVDLYSEAPLVLGGPNGDRKANWIEYCIYEVQRIDKNWEMLMRYSSYMDSECIALLSKMQSPGSLLDLIRKVFPLCHSTNRRFSFGNGSETTFVDFWDYIKEQEVYYNTVLLKYQNS